MREGKASPSRAGVFTETVALIARAEVHRLSGDPRADWSTIRSWLRGAKAAELRKLDASLDNLLRYTRGRLIASGLAAKWQETGSYEGARATLDIALAQDQLMFGPEDTGGIHVMTMHKAKGKQFDGVVMYRDKYASPLVTRHDKAPYKEARRLVRVSITRARHGVLVLAQAGAPCPIMAGFKLKG